MDFSPYGAAAGGDENSTLDVDDLEDMQDEHVLDFVSRLERIDQDESGTVSAEEFLSLMMMIQYNPLQGQHASDLTIELSTDCWNAVLARESEQHMCSQK